MQPPDPDDRVLSQEDIAAMTIEEGAFIDASCTVVEPHRLILRRGAYIGTEGFIDATGGVEIGEAVRISYRCMIISNTHHISRSVWRRSREGDRHRPVLIERGCWLGAGVTLYPGVTVREGCVVNAGAVLSHSTEANGLYCPPSATRIKDLDITHDLPLELAAEPA